MSGDDTNTYTGCSVGSITIINPMDDPKGDWFCLQGDGSYRVGAERMARMLAMEKWIEEVRAADVGSDKLYKGRFDAGNDVYLPWWAYDRVVEWFPSQDKPRPRGQ